MIVRRTVWRTCPARRDGSNWLCLARRREGLVGT